jgi:hypothetical protein
MGAASAAPFLLSFTLKRPCSGNTKKGKMFVILSAAKDLLLAFRADENARSLRLRSGQALRLRRLIHARISRLRSG